MTTSDELSDVIDDDGSGDSSLIKQDEISNSSTVQSLELLQNILQDGRAQNQTSDSSEKDISEEIYIQSDHANKSSSTTDNEELLRQFREQQVTRRYRPRSAKVKHDSSLFFEKQPRALYYKHDTTSSFVKLQTIQLYFYGIKDNLIIFVWLKL